MKPTRKTGETIDWQAMRNRLAQAAAATEESHRLTPERMRAILQERARIAARIPPQAPAAGSVLEVIRFHLGEERYAVETRYLREILRVKEITPLPGTPDFLVGIANLRGQIMAVFDLRRLFGISLAGETELTRVIVLGQERIEFGVLADAVDQVAMLPLDEVKESPASVAGITREYVRGVTADALILLDGAVLLRDPRLTIDLGTDG